ncbi:nucleoside-diphosphate kinase [Spirochaeta thermophila]|uniref:Nucleoside diphosphate kinase n=1 Tax=Winmispira thermophila (strain ATCC 49972 / DSM 6192 / RI 19.B1) TaxID=665571 RepID=E0RP06_WINT6|nr:nucleoside-diphosphate kinase [Spirochaeta thermophila]ADN02668.1 nucleoside-diphosphate kinase [Spirochaeta thermophila DSM 6192]
MGTQEITRTLCLVKPDGVRRGLVGRILTRFEDAGLKIVAMKMLVPDEERARRHYRYEDIAVRHGEAVWNRLVQFLCSGPVVAFVLEGVDVVPVVRKLCGSTEPASAPPGTIRGDFAHHTYEYTNSAQGSVRNLIHASATDEEAAYEISVWFREEELVSGYKRSDEAEHYLS